MVHTSMRLCIGSLINMYPPGASIEQTAEQQSVWLPCSHSFMVTAEALCSKANTCRTRARNSGGLAWAAPPYGPAQSPPLIHFSLCSLRQ